MLVGFTGLSSSIIKDIDFELDEIIILGGTVLVRYKVPDDRWSFVTGAYLKSAVLPGTIQQRSGAPWSEPLIFWTRHEARFFSKSAITY